MVIANFLIKYLRILKAQLIVYKTIGCCFIESALYNSKCQINCRAHGKHYNQNDVFTYGLLTGFIHKLFPLEMHHTNTEESSQADKNRVDKVKIKSTQEINEITGSQPVTCRTKRRHQCSSNGNTRNHIPFFLGRESHDTCQTTKKRDEYIINSGRCTCQQL